MSINSLGSEAYEYCSQPIITPSHTLGRIVFGRKDESSLIAKFLKGKDLFSFVGINSAIQTDWNRKAVRKEAARIKAEVLPFPPQLIKACGGIEKMDELPILTLTKDAFMKPTIGRPGNRGPNPPAKPSYSDYIDFLQPSDECFNKGPVLKGIDYLGRPFIAFKYFVNKYDECQVEVIFSRYAAQTLDLKQYTGCSRSSSRSSFVDHIMGKRAQMGSHVPEILDRIRRLVHHLPVGNVVQIDDPENLGCNKFIENPDREISEGVSQIQIPTLAEFRRAQEEDEEDSACC